MFALLLDNQTLSIKDKCIAAVIASRFNDRLEWNTTVIQYKNIEWINTIKIFLFLNIFKSQIEFLSVTKLV